MKNKQKYYEFYKQEENAVFEGWDFSRLDSRWIMEPLPWEYKDVVKANLDAKDVLLDLGTGDGEYLKQFRHPYALTHVTEGYVPNYELCLKTLKPLGIDVQFSDDDVLPFEDDFFDVIVNRHESFNLEEVYRVLKSGGLFITQQVGSDNSKQLSERILDKALIVDEKNRLSHTLEKAETIGFKCIQANEHHASLKFFDVGAVVYYAKIIKWEFPGFNVDDYFDNLLRLEDDIAKDGFVLSHEHRYYCVLKK